MTAQYPQVEHIAQALGFTLDDLALNRLGRMSAHQGWEVARQGLGLLGMVMAGIGGILVVLFLIKPAGLYRLVYLPIPLGAVLFIAMASPTIAGAWQHKVVSAEGALDFRQAGRWPTMVVGQAHISAPAGSADVLTRGQIYRVYYVQRSDQFLSIEPVVKVR
jgi:hypothetical protein